MLVPLRQDLQLEQSRVGLHLQQVVQLLHRQITKHGYDVLLAQHVKFFALRNFIEGLFYFL